MAYPNVTKCVLDLKQRDYGWTETYYLDSVSSGLLDEMTKLTNLATKRIALSGSDTFISYLKVSNEALKRDVRLNYVGEPGDGAYQGNPTKRSDVQTTAMLVHRLNSDRTKLAPLYVRGIWDEIVKDGGALDFGNTEFNAAWNAYVAQLLADHWGFLAKDPTSPATAFINSVVQDAGGQIVVGCNANIFGAGQINKKARVFISGVQGAASVNGTQVVIVTSTSAFKTVNRIPMFDYTGGGQATSGVPKWFEIADARRRRIVERKPGRPSYLSRGRQRARKLA